MLVGLDISKALEPRDGIGRYTAELLRALIDELSAAGEVELLLYSLAAPIDRDLFAACYPQCPKNVRLRTGRPHDDRPDLFHVTDWKVPAALRSRLVFTCYDLTFLTLPDYHTLENKIHCLTGVLEAELAGASFLAISRAGAEELEARIGVGAERIRVIYPAAAPAFRRLPEADVRRRLAARFDLAGEYVLAVGTLEPRKNLATLVEAYTGLDDETKRRCPLLLAGGGGWKVDPNELLRHASVRRLGYVGGEDLVDLYNGATVFAYPSIAEGFGLPVAEAMACGAPVVTSDRSSLPEVAGDAARLVDPHDAGALRSALRDLIEQPAERERYRRLGFERSARFTWRQTARQTLELYRDITTARPATQ